MSESSKHENKCEIIRALNFVERWSGTIGIVIALGSLVAAIYAVILPFQQWQQDIADKQEDAVQEQKDRKVAEEKWREEGAMFSLAYITNRDQQLSDTDLETGVTSVQSNHAMVITNSGRTQGTIIAIRQTDSPRQSRDRLHPLGVQQRKSGSVAEYWRTCLFVNATKRNRWDEYTWDI
ncbi:hypothetical protein [Bifidobacterium callimiconis]|uniref:Uncharacterized protein n=1 Tax=Bifidobacterium callimiconis TaxID=2306973 RepID=A0A430FD47_9BIFI|nr:hypothetical protein [Bifidobacterium callimiconis]RSX50773.1 hypothetical protein D2E23_1438 [Bifidobacterium callimiconis]